MECVSEKGRELNSCSKEFFQHLHRLAFIAIVTYTYLFVKLFVKHILSNKYYCKYTFTQRELDGISTWCSY